MDWVGILPEDAPDPRVEGVESLKRMPIPVLGLMPQPSLEDTDSVSLNSVLDDRGYSEMTASITYTLWRNPDDRSDPVNLADLESLRAIEEVPPWSRPPWLIEQVERMRYPQLWEAVRTTWHREPHSSLESLLADHVNHILMNQFREEVWPGGKPWEQHAPVVTGRMVNSRARTVINGVEVPGAEVDTDPFVYGIGARLADGAVVTAVLPRAELERIQVRFTTRN
ncbi:hypothetical protein H9639_01185 [Arthrobacter sp. Sa2CUA1]|uniref:Uncharacterized protein n=1 Tax=Arthrobacter gallicola TaxID=2762225 RepID=A0ABR8UMX7_9MICC|nr:hypothetical protein [Arthrobacter gallicola]MBD7993913.1 hypothetical protein [Arthrobacter gallicola]